MEKREIGIVTMDIDTYKQKVIELFKSGKASDEQWEEMATHILYASEGGEAMAIDEGYLMISKWLEKRRERKEQERKDQAFRNGFKWAMEMHYIDSKFFEEIESYLWSELNDVFGDAFDRGAEKAIRIILMEGK